MRDDPLTCCAILGLAAAGMMGAVGLAAAAPHLLHLGAYAAGLSSVAWVEGWTRAGGG